MYCLYVACVLYSFELVFCALYLCVVCMLNVYNECFYIEMCCMCAACVLYSVMLSVCVLNMCCMHVIVISV